jgi:hypothetical protein
VDPTRALRRVFHAPPATATAAPTALLNLEVAQALQRYAATGQIKPGRCRDALSDLLDFLLYCYPHDVLLPPVWNCGTI